MPLQEMLESLSQGERFGFRLRIKPSWSGRVYGTFSVRARLVLALAVFSGATAALFLRLLALQLSSPSVDVEIAALTRCNAHAAAASEILLPARARELQRRGEEMFSLSYRLRTILGIQEARLALPGLGRMDGEEEDFVRPAGTRALLNKVGGDVALLSGQFERLDRELSAQEDQLRFTPSVAPIFQSQFVPTSGFGPRVSPFTRLPEVHRGQDLAAEFGTKIIATADGIVLKADRVGDSRMGRYVIIDHSGRYQTYYGHCDRVFVEEGESIRRHQIIAEVGSTGRSTGPHVHYEVRVEGEPRNPLQFLVFDPHFSSEEQLRVE